MHTKLIKGITEIHVYQATGTEDVYKIGSKYFGKEVVALDYQCDIRKIGIYGPEDTVIGHIICPVDSEIALVK